MEKWNARTRNKNDDIIWVVFSRDICAPRDCELYRTPAFLSTVMQRLAVRALTRCVMSNRAPLDPYTELRIFPGRERLLLCRSDRHREVKAARITGPPRVNSRHLEMGRRESHPGHLSWGAKLTRREPLNCFTCKSHCDDILAVETYKCTFP